MFWRPLVDAFSIVVRLFPHFSTPTHAQGWPSGEGERKKKRAQQLALVLLTSRGSSFWSAAPLKKLDASTKDTSLRITAREGRWLGQGNPCPVEPGTVRKGILDPGDPLIPRKGPKKSLSRAKQSAGFLYSKGRQKLPPNGRETFAPAQTSTLHSLCPWQHHLLHAAHGDWGSPLLYFVLPGMGREPLGLGQEFPCSRFCGLFPTPCAVQVRGREEAMHP